MNENQILYYLIDAVIVSSQNGKIPEHFSDMRLVKAESLEEAKTKYKKFWEGNNERFKILNMKATQTLG